MDFREGAPPLDIFLTHREKQIYRTLGLPQYIIRLHYDMSSAIELISWMLEVSSNLYALGMKRSVSESDAYATTDGKRCASSDTPTGRSDRSRVSSPSLFVCSECGDDILQGSSVYCMLDKRFCSNKCRRRHHVADAFDRAEKKWDAAHTRTGAYKAHE